MTLEKGLLGFIPFFGFNFGFILESFYAKRVGKKCAYGRTTTHHIGGLDGELWDMGFRDHGDFIVKY